MPIIKSILDLDIYKLTMQQAIARFYPHISVQFEFFNRSKLPFFTSFSEKQISAFINAVHEELESVSKLKLTNDELSFLTKNCTYFTSKYLELLRNFKFKPSEVQISRKGQELKIKIQGAWERTTLWETILLSIVSELYYKTMGHDCNLKVSSDCYHTWLTNLNKKAKLFNDAGIVVTEFGTRRRFSYSVQSQTIEHLKALNCLDGTSNVHLAHVYNLIPHGTMPHEWIMAHAAMFGYKKAHNMMLLIWSMAHKKKLNVAPPDTFTTDVFLRDFDLDHATWIGGLRQDSGNWKTFTEKVIQHYEKLGIDPKSKYIIYSDGLDAVTACQIYSEYKDKIGVKFGIGTFLTNDVGVKPLNIVIKMTKCEDNPTVKLSDNPEKYTGISEEIETCKKELGL